MNEVLRPVLGKFALVYLDDVIIFSKSFQEHIYQVSVVLSLIRDAILQIKKRKCQFFTQVIKFLGYEISEEGIRTDPDKVKAMQMVPPPTNLKGVQSVLGLFNYY